MSLPQWRTLLIGAARKERAKMSTYRTEAQESTGDRIKSIDKEIIEIERALELIVSGSDSSNRIYGEGLKMLADFRLTLELKIRDLQSIRATIIKIDPSPNLIVCPHCGYDGEFECDNPNHDGFRVLQPVLEPRIVIGYGSSKLLLSDTDDMHDPFDMVSEPSYYNFMDDPESISPDFVELRKSVRGKWLFCCGKCFEYFSMKDFMGKCSIEYSGDSPHESKWRKNR